MVNPLTLDQARLILGIDESSTLDDVKKAYRSKALLFHPDKTGTSEYDKFVQLTQAYELVSSRIDSSSSYNYNDVFKNKYSNNKKRYSDLDSMMQFFSMNPEKMFEFINDMIYSARPKKVDDLASILEREEYSTARKFYESDKSLAVLTKDKVIQTLQNNISKKKFYEIDISKHLNELSFYCVELGVNFKESVEKISDVVLKKTEEYVLKKEFIEHADKKSFVEYLDNKLSFLDSIPLDTDKIESSFEKKLFDDLQHNLRFYNLDKLYLTLDKISILDEYFSSEDNPKELLNRSYELFYNNWSGRTVSKYDRDYVYRTLQAYAVRGIEPAKKLNKTFRITHRL